MEIYLIIGVILYVSIVLDIIQTTLSMQGGGWLTSRFSHLFWKLFLAVSGRNGKSKILAHAGYILLISIVLTWVVFLWASLVLILYSHPGAIVDSTTKIPATFGQISYYSGYTLSTLGMGDYIASADIWRMITSLYSFTGLILLTMSVTYFIPVLSAVIDQRKLGISLSTLGSSPQEILIRSWNGENFDSLINKVDGISDSLIKYSQQHRAYPVIHFFHNNKEESTIILQLARLYEALLIISEKVKTEIRPENKHIYPLEVAYDNYFEVITEVTHIGPDQSAPTVSKTDKLIEKELVSQFHKEAKSSEKVSRNRKIFKALIRQDGWDWSQVDIKSS
ncbi:potassium channel family protein [Christiangramia sediminis]|uniref:Potassium channel family protein n=1 Tax=Christiangramia sediminis TaxID=2881336 RepID=A0A9X1LJG7_9FLAO|nr:potassium channel family protein [Christiangramia sediminis]MCB7481493.1 potassium channel family protein [Christiangramia sediminis]